MLVMAGTAHLNAEDEMRALAAFRDAKELAEAHGFVEAQVHALLGAAGTHFGGGRYGEAEPLYAETAELTGEHEGLQLIRLEALRMRGTCLEKLNDPAAARALYDAALEVAEQMPPAEARTTAYAFAGERLAALCEQSGDIAAAEQARQRVAAVAQRPAPRARAHESPIAGGDAAIADSTRRPST